MKKRFTLEQFVGIPHIQVLPVGSQGPDERSLGANQLPVRDGCNEILGHDVPAANMIKSILFVAAVSLVGAPLAFAESKPDVKANPAKADIVDTAVAAGNFKTLAKALTEAGLVETLKGTGPFTVFAPTDEAFAKLPKGTVEALLKDKKKLTAILTYHVVSGKVMAADAAKLATAKTVNGKSLAIKASDGGVTINGAKVIKADIEASNGVIHVIDTVLLPK